MTNDKTAPATKDDVHMIMEQLGKMYDLQERWKNELHDDMETWKNELHGDMDKWKKEVTDHFDLVAENIRYDFSSANREEIEVLKDARKAHDKRILALERTAGLAV